MPILLIGLVNVLVSYLPFVDRFVQWWLASLIALALIAGAFTPDRLLWFTALSTSIPTLMARTRQHGSLFDCFWAGFLYPELWLYFLYNFAPVYAAYVVFVRIGMTVRTSAAAFKEGYSGR
jgi:hypothetical protein